MIDGRRVCGKSLDIFVYILGGGGHLGKQKYNEKRENARASMPTEL